MAHGDYTGRLKQQLATEYAEQQQLAAHSKSMVTTTVQENKNEVVDLFIDKDYENLHTKRQVADNGELEVVEVDVEDPQFKPVRFRASDDVDQVTVGQGREFNLKAGRNYQAPRWVVEHLDSIGLVWH